MKLTREQIQQILPHRDPMLLVDAVEELEPGHSIRALFRVDPQRDIFRGHFPGEPVLPGVYTVECMAQTADILVMTLPCYAGKLPLLLGVDKARFLRKIIPGCTVELRARVVSHRPEKAIVTCAAEAYAGEELAADGLITLALR